MELQGTVKKITDIQTFASGFQKKELVLLTHEQYPQPINIEFLQEKINLLDNVNEGENVKIGINIRGREWTNPQGEIKYFNSIVGWRIEKVYDHESTAEPTGALPQKSTPTVATDGDPFEDEEDDLPF